MHLRYFLVTLSLLGLAAMLPLCLAELQVVSTNRFENTVTLECRDSAGTPQAGAEFWLNTISRENELRALRDPAVDILPGTGNDGRITFIITRELEGTYYCGRNLADVSPMGQMLIAYPHPTIRPSRVNKFFAKVGTTAFLRCSILPGELRGQYYADWINSTSMTEVARVVGPRTTGHTPTPDQRFAVNQETFTLNISNVRLTDSGNYRCILGVKDPAGQRFSYAQTETYDLELIVYKDPFITRPPQERVVVALNDSIPNQRATFRCEARGDPAPEIEWLHQSAKVKDSPISGKYSVITSPTPTPAGDFIVTSTLTINQLSAFDAGDVKCVVMADDVSLPTGVDLQTDSASSVLAILGAINHLNVLITTGGDIFFEIQHPSTILVPVQLYILYIDATDPSRTVPQVSTTVYQSTSLITHFVPSSLIPSGFTRVRIMIALQHRDLQSPIYTSGLDYDRSVPTVFTEEEASVQRTLIISITVTIAIVAFLSAIVIPVLASIICKHRYNRKKKGYKTKIHEHETELKDFDSKKDGYEQELQQLRQDNEAALDELRENHRQELQQSQQQYDADLKELKENHRQELDIQRNEKEASLQKLSRTYEHEERLKVLEIFPHIAKEKGLKCLKVTLGTTVLTVETSIEEECGVDMVDGDHTLYQAHSDRRARFKREKTIDYDSNGRYSDEDYECVVDCMKSVVKASITDSKLGPVLRQFMSTEQ